MTIQLRRIREIWQRITATRYTQALEAQLARLQAENVRLRQENRALLNSILGITGIPPVSVATPNAGVSGTTSSAENPRTYPTLQSGPEAPASGPVSPSNDADSEKQSDSIAETQPRPRARANPEAARGKNVTQVAPMRRRSWQQINRTLELEAARKKAGRDADASETQ